MRLRLILSALMLIVFATTSIAHAELSEAYAEWDEGPEGFLLTKAEKKEWKKIATDAEAKRFIELFWARRNPKPEMPFNEFKAKFDALVAYADENFGYEKSGKVAVRGAITDRAKVIILLGFPHMAEHRGPTETVQAVGGALGDTGMGTDQVRSNAIMWMYDPARLPEEFGTKGTRVLFVFYEERTGSNNFILDRSHQEATMALRTMSKGPEVYFLHPDLDEVPKPVSVPGGESATAAQLAWLDSGSAEWDEKAKVIVDPGLADADHRYLWFHLQLPVDAPELETLAGRISGADGEVLSNFQVAATPLPAGGNTAYHLAFPVAEGAYKVEVVGSASGEAKVVYSGDHEVSGIPLEGAWLSPLWMGVSAEQEQGSPLGAPFNFGGWHLIPLDEEGQTPKDNQLSYFGFVVRPGLGEDGSPALSAKIVLKKDGERLGNPLRMDLAAAQVTKDVYLYANALNIGAFPAPATYTLEFTIQDKVSKEKVKRSVTLNLAE